jgi:hypothetical protein
LKIARRGSGQAVDRGANSKAARLKPHVAIFHAFDFVISHLLLSCASRLTSVAHSKELFKPSSPRIICREIAMHQIRYFLAVSEYLNFRRAASAMNFERKR